MIRSFAAALFVISMVASQPGQADNLTVDVYKSPYCGCCTGWAEAMQKAGFTVRQHKIDDMDAVKRRFGVHGELEACHTATVGGYVVEGHVPVEEVVDLLKSKPQTKGIALPGMPEGVPGMPGERPKNLTLYTLDAQPKIYKVIE